MPGNNARLIILFVDVLGDGNYSEPKPGTRINTETKGNVSILLNDKKVVLRFQWPCRDFVVWKCILRLPYDEKISGKWLIWDSLLNSNKDDFFQYIVK